MNDSVLDQQRTNAQQALRMRSECGLPYAPIIIFGTGDDLHITPADSERGQRLTQNHIIEIIDAHEDDARRWMLRPSTNQLPDTRERNFHALS